MPAQIKHFFMLLTLLSGFLTLSACTSIESYVPGYLQALNQYPASSIVAEEDIKNRFIEVFENLDNPKLENFVENLYAEDFYFNDTLHTFTDRSELTDYLIKTGHNIGSIGIEIDEVTVADNDIYLRWVMSIRYDTLNKGEEIRSIGISHLRVDDNGQVVLQQDFWDGVDAFYKHIPFLGNLIGLVRKSL